MVCKCGSAGPFYASNGKTCQECVKARAAERNKSEAGRRYEKKRSRRPARRVYAHSVLSAWRKANPDKVKAQVARNAKQKRARTAVSNAIRDRRLVRPDRCSVEGCRASRIEAHHEDYDQQLVVVWLCKRHHRKADIAMQEKARRR